MVPRPSGHLQENPSCARQSPRPPGHLQETLRQSATMARPSWYLQETPRRCKTVSQTVEAPAENFQTVCDGEKTVLAPAGIAHGARQ
ncbi:hypothetical protein DPMN_068649 [Dreissena polymorpha]|uniref:Uncharacterized protein n=1 Tax=Dreissena polymorpha TaxID=45954 RepID=A0A9D4BUF0_DREPO|nr:hypothetical protein DPMN_068649 [Dreissena polymorpha]